MIEQCLSMSANGRCDSEIEETQKKPYEIILIPEIHSLDEWELGARLTATADFLKNIEWLMAKASGSSSLFAIICAGTRTIQTILHRCFGFGKILQEIYRADEILLRLVLALNGKYISSFFPFQISQAQFRARGSWSSNLAFSVRWFGRKVEFFNES